MDTNYSFSIIFDMDGVVVDNTNYHIVAWQKFARQFGLKLSAGVLRKKYMGRLAKDTIKAMIGKIFL
jgi:beta-phosphoglucomutase-like phosphatase (HAD superfamily)